MRPEYVDAVDAVRWGWSLWVVFVIPAGLIWLSALWPKGSCLISASGFAVAVVACWILLVFHSNHIQATKERLRVTEAEQRDWASDTWNTFAGVTAVPYSLIYCSLNALLAYGVRYTVHGVCYIVQRFFRRNRSCRQSEDIDLS